MEDASIRRERAQNLWASFERKVHPMARGARLLADPNLRFEQIGGLAGPKEEILTYSCAATDPGVYARWGTAPPSGMLLIGESGVGKNLLARALAHATDTSYLRVDIPRLVLDMLHSLNKVGELLQAWSQILEEMPPLTIFFDEIEFSQAQEFGEQRRDLPVGPIMDFLLEVVDRAIANNHHLVVGATAHPNTLRHAFVRPGRFERVVDVTPSFPDDHVAALEIHAAAAEERAGRSLFETVEWKKVVGEFREATTGDWVRILHAVLRSKARCEASGEDVDPIVTKDLEREVERFGGTRKRIHTGAAGNYV